MPPCAHRGGSWRPGEARPDAGRRRTVFRAGSLAVLLLKDAALLQLRHQQLDDIAEGFVSDGIGEVKAIDVRLFDPGLQFVRHGLRAANHQRTEAADPRPIGGACTVHWRFGSAVEKASTAD